MITSKLKNLDTKKTSSRSAKASVQNDIVRIHQKTLISLKSDWSAEFIHWTEIISSFTRLAKSQSIKRRKQQMSLLKFVWELKSMMDEDFKQIENEIDLLLGDSYDRKLQQAGYEFCDRLGDLHSDMAYFRKKARSTEIDFLKNVRMQLPLIIY